MNWNKVSGIVILLAVAVIGGAYADVVTVDGTLSPGEWDNPYSYHNDPQDVYYTGGSQDGVPMPGYDIDYTAYIYGEDTGNSYFLGVTMAPISKISVSDYVEFLINADDDATTGAPNWQDARGPDYRVEWDLDAVLGDTYDASTGPALHLPQWYIWSGDQITGGWLNMSSTLNPGQVAIAYDNVTGTGGYSAIELVIDSKLFGSPNTFTWGMYLDNGTLASDDASPDNYNQRGYTPEPTTLVLLPFGLAGLAAWRRRRDA